MRILLVSPAPIGQNTAELGGVAGYTTDLARALGDLGHSVGVATAGHVYTPGPLRRREGRCRAERLAPLDGIERYQIVNSPVLAPSLWQFGEPESEQRQPLIERAFASILKRQSPEVVHIHGFEGLCSTIVRLSREAGARVLVSLHNYHPFCPQVYLMRGRRRLCLDYDAGRACESCEAVIDVARERVRRALAPDASPPTIQPPPLPPIQTFRRDGSPTAETLRLWHGRHPHWQPMEHDALPSDAPPSSAPARSVAGRYAARRSAFVGALNDADRVIAVSNTVAEIAAGMGVDRGRITVNRIGSWAASAPRVEPPANDPAERGQLRLVFLGFNNYYKGLPVLVDAIGLLTPAFRSRVHLAAIGTNCDAIASRVDPLRPHIGGVEIGGSYDRNSVSDLLQHRHLGVVPSVWHDNGPQTAIEMRAVGLPVVGARIGGIPNIIRDGIDGLLFRANDRFALARVLARTLTTPGLLAGLRQSLGPWTPVSRHAEDMCGLYEAALSSV